MAESFKLDNELRTALDPQSARASANRDAILLFMAALHAEEDAIRAGRREPRQPTRNTPKDV